MKYANCGFGLDAFTTNTQAVFDGGDYGAFDGAWNFTVDHFANAASILFNGAKMVATNFTFNQPNFVGRFAQRGLLFTVKKSHIEYILANKSLRTIFIRVWEIAPKCQGSWNQTNNAERWNDDGTTYTNVANTEALKDPKPEWQDAITADKNLNSRTISIGAYNEVPMDRINNTPQKSPSFMNKFKSSVIKELRLEPGQFTKFKVNGPNEFKIDMAKYTNETTYHNVQKFSRGIIFAAQLDTLAHFNDPNFGGFSRAKPQIKNSGLLIEKKLYIKLEAPECTPDGNMKNVQVEDWFDLTASGTPLENTDEATIAQ